MLGALLDAATCTLLIDAGADVRATMRVYGGAHTTLTLLETSAHPADAGVGEAVARVLRGR